MNDDDDDDDDVVGGGGGSDRYGDRIAMTIIIILL